MDSAQVALRSAEPEYAPIPYQFAYKAESNEGSYGQEETSDGNGRRQGSYNIALADGRQRTVSYVADENGFHAEVSTNELGTESKDSADVKYISSAITGEQAAVQYGAVAPTAQKLKIVQAAAPVVKIAAAPIVNYATAPAPVIRYAAPAPTIVKTVQTAPVIKTVQATPVINTITHAAPTVVKTIQAAPVSYTVAHAPVSYATTHAASAGPSFIQFKYGDHAAHDIHLHEIHHRA
ncbi:hypothetical protein BIW11_00618 [Tropilaelaps mercedesae]|uniref:Cuticle protein 10.9-like n=1 Tax=Tropilaelaps mercedesae TaxID=418985 RepID=A0A1V9XS57_9ACAR|nr:hypothetical protein BIW11_00618 [Tropilaelaps mercedesae]